MCCHGMSLDLRWAASVFFTQRTAEPPGSAPLAETCAWRPKRARFTRRDQALRCLYPLFAAVLSLRRRFRPPRRRDLAGLAAVDEGGRDRPPGLSAMVGTR